MQINQRCAGADVPEGQQSVVIEMLDARTLELFKGGKGDSMVADSGASRRTDYEGFVGTSPVNPDCSVKEKEAHK